MSRHERAADEIIQYALHPIPYKSSAKDFKPLKEKLVEILKDHYGNPDLFEHLIKEGTRHLEGQIDNLRGDFSCVGDRVRDLEGRLAIARRGLGKIGSDATHAIVANIAINALREIGE